MKPVSAYSFCLIYVGRGGWRLDIVESSSHTISTPTYTAAPAFTGLTKSRRCCHVEFQVPLWRAGFPACPFLTTSAPPPSRLSAFETACRIQMSFVEDKKIRRPCFFKTAWSGFFELDTSRSGFCRPCSRATDRHRCASSPGRCSDQWSASHTGAWGGDLRAGSVCFEVELIVLLSGHDNTLLRRDGMLVITYG